MTEQDDANRAVAEAKEAIAFGDFSGALDKLETAVGSVPAGHADALWLFARIREAADNLARSAPRYAPEAQTIRDLIVGRVGYLPDSRAGEQSAEPWFYGVAETVTGIALIAAILSVVGGILGGVEAAYTGHHAGVIALWAVAAGVFAAALWLAVAVGLKLLLEIGRSLRASRSEH